MGCNICGENKVNHPHSGCMYPDFEPYEEKYKRLKAAIEKHRAQKADDRCIFDDDELYAELRDGIKCDRRVGSKEDMLANCKRFIDRRCEVGGWATYALLEKQIADLKHLIWAHMPDADKWLDTLEKQVRSACADSGIMRSECI